MKLKTQNLNLKLFFLPLICFIGAKSFSQIDSRNINAERHIGAENRSIESSNRSINAERRIDQGLSTGERPKFLLGEPDAPLLDVNPDKSKTLDMTEQSDTSPGPSNSNRDTFRAQKVVMAEFIKSLANLKI